MTSLSKHSAVPNRSWTTGRGFSLIELMITVAVVGILLAVALPSYSTYVTRSRRSDAKTAVLDLASREERFYSINNVFTNDPVLLGYGTGSTFPLAVQTSSTSYYALNVTASSASEYTAVAIPTGTQTADISCYGYQVNHLGVLSNIDAGNAIITNTGCW